jgi:hypothetical protein
MTASRIIVAAIVLALPIHPIAAQARSSRPPTMTPEQREAAQARLNAEADLIPKAPLDPAKKELRSAVSITRDSVAVAAATASLLVRAQAAKSIGVERSQARRLRGQCAAAKRSSAVTLTAIASLHTPDEKGTKLLLDYRAALAEVGQRMGECDKLLGTDAAAAGPSAASIGAAITQVNNAAVRHDRALDNLMRGMEITLPARH